MKKRMFILVIFSSFTFLLAGCNQSLEDLIKIGEDILASLTGDAETEQIATDGDDVAVVEDDEGLEDEDAAEAVANDRADENGDASDLGGSVAFKGGPYTPFHVQLQEDGYNLYSLPNGFPFELPYHWILVGGEFGTSQHYFEGNFCFYLPYEQADLVDVFADYTGADVTRNGGDGDYFETTSYTLNSEVYNTSGTISYYVDNHDHTCAYLTVDDSNAEIFYAFFGEDPNTMVGPGDPDYDGPIEREAVELENFHFVDDDRQRSLPNDYDDIVASLATSELNKDDGAKSIRQAIKTGEMGIQHIEERFMRILPYEWFFLDYEEVPQSDVWSAEFCTDLTVEQSLAAQLNMLENYNADIFEISLTDGTTPELAEVRFEFNDPYYTGSWNGRTWFNHTDNSGDTSGYRCMHVDMHFSTDRLD